MGQSTKWTAPAIALASALSAMKSSASKRPSPMGRVLSKKPPICSIKRFAHTLSRSIPRISAKPLPESSEKLRKRSRFVLLGWRYKFEFELKSGSFPIQLFHSHFQFVHTRASAGDPDYFPNVFDEFLETILLVHPKKIILGTRSQKRIGIEGNTCLSFRGIAHNVCSLGICFTEINKLLCRQSPCVLGEAFPLRYRTGSGRDPNRYPLADRVQLHRLCKTCQFCEEYR